jgi:hypothetical protein
MGAVPHSAKLRPPPDSLPNGGSHINGRAHCRLTCAVRLPRLRKLGYQAEPQNFIRLRNAPLAFSVSGYFYINPLSNTRLHSKSYH